jgi:hypothetical protein
VRFSVLTAAVMKMTVFRDVAACGLAEFTDVSKVLFTSIFGAGSFVFCLLSAARSKAVSLYVLQALGRRGGIAPTHY